MGGKSSSTQQTSQQSQTDPWSKTIPSLTQIIGGLNQSTGQYQPTAAENQAISQMQANAQSLPNWVPQASGFVGNLLGGGNDVSPMVKDAYSQYQQQLTPYAQGQYLDPTQAPGMANVLDTIRNDVSNNVNGLFAGAGRDLSGAHTQTLARGIAQGEAAPLLNQYQTNQGIQQNAINNLYNGGILGANTLSGLYQTGLGNQAAGLQLAPQVGNADARSQATLATEQMRRGLPLSNLGQVLNLLLPIAGLGQQSTGSGTSTTNNTMSGAQQFATIAGGIGSLFPKAPMTFSFGGGG